MSPAEFEEFVGAVRRENPAWLDGFEALIATSSEVAEIEHELGVRLPDEYRWFMMRYGGGAFGFLDVLPVRPGAGFEGLVEANAEPIAANFIAVAPVGTGDQWGFRSSDGVCTSAVYFLDHETAEVEFQSRDFLEFLSGVALNPDA